MPIAVMLVLGPFAALLTLEPATRLDLSLRAAVPTRSTIDAVLKAVLPTPSGIDAILARRDSVGGALSRPIDEWVGVAAFLDDSAPSRTFHHFHDPLQPRPIARPDIRLLLDADGLRRSPSFPTSTEGITTGRRYTPRP